MDREEGAKLPHLEEQLEYHHITDNNQGLRNTVKEEIAGHERSDEGED